MTNYFFLLVSVLALLSSCSSGSHSLPVNTYYIYSDSNNFESIHKNFNENKYIPAFLKFDLDTTKIKLRIRGDSSREYPKKSLKIKVLEDRKVNGKSKLNLNAEYKDQSFSHSYLSSLIFKELNYPCFSSSIAATYVNNSFHGLFMEIENMDADQSRAVYEMAQKTIDNYGDRINDDVLNMMERLKGAILDKLGIEEKEEEPEEEEEEEQEEEIRPRTVSEYKAYLKNLNFYQHVDGLRKDELVVIYDMLKQGQTDERVRAQIDEYHFDRNPRQRRGRRPQKGKGLTQVGKGIKEDLHKIMLLVGSQKAGNQSLKLQKEINTIQKKLKKQLDKMKKKDKDKLMKEVNRQQIKRMAKSQIGLGHRD